MTRDAPIACSNNIGPPCSQSTTNFVELAEENHIRDLIENVDDVKCSRAMLNSLSSKQIRLAFFALFRKTPFQPLDSCLDKTCSYGMYVSKKRDKQHCSLSLSLATITGWNCIRFPWGSFTSLPISVLLPLNDPRLDKKELSELLVKEYQRLGSPLEKYSLAELIKRAEIELSKNSTFTVMHLSYLTWLG